MFSDIPAMAWVVLALGLMWLGLRWWQQKQAAIRAEARELRMAELMAERERMLAPAKDEAPPKDKVCLGCRTVNPGASTTCAGCGLEL
jgi:hypothetical protein